MSTFSDFLLAWPRGNKFAWKIAPVKSVEYGDWETEETEYVLASIFVDLETKVKTAGDLAKVVQKLDLAKGERDYLDASIVKIDRLDNKLIAQSRLNRNEPASDNDDGPASDDEPSSDDEPASDDEPVSDDDFDLP